MSNAPMSHVRRSGFRALLWLTTLFGLSLPAELWASDRPMLIVMRGRVYFPTLFFYPETAFGGQFRTAPDYAEPEFNDLLAQQHARIIRTPLRFGPDTVDAGETRPAPASPSLRHPLGTDDRQRDVLARLIYGVRLSLGFALLLALGVLPLGTLFGAVQGYFAGTTDLLLQRFAELWSSLPTFYMLLIAASFVNPGFLSLLGLLILLSWHTPSGIVRTQFFRFRNAEYVRAARTLGVSDAAIMWRHILPQTAPPLLAAAPFLVAAGIEAPAALDFLGLGLPPGTASLGDLIVQARNNLQAPHLAIVACVALGGITALLLMIGESLRKAFDPRRAGAVQAENVRNAAAIRSEARPSP